MTDTREIHRVNQARHELLSRLFAPGETATVASPSAWNLRENTPARRVEVAVIKMSERLATAEAKVVIGGPALMAMLGSGGGFRPFDADADLVPLDCIPGTAAGVFAGMAGSCWRWIPDDYFLVTTISAWAADPEGSGVVAPDYLAVQIRDDGGGYEPPEIYRWPA